MGGKLQITTPSDRELAMTREFDAPRDLVYEAWTKPELIRKWLGVFGGWTFKVCDVDLRPGGTYRWVWQNGHGQEMGLRGVYQEIVPNERIVSEETFDEPWYEGKAIGTVEFAETNGRTVVTMTMRYDSKEIRDGAMKSGMESGISASYDNLEEILLAKTAI